MSTIDFHFPEKAAFAKTQHEAVAELAEMSATVLRFGESLKKSSAQQLNQRPSEKSWSALECLEHLNRYADHYLPLLNAKVEAASPRGKEDYKPGLLGKPFALAMHPARRKKKISSPGNMNPLGSSLDANAVVNQFVSNMESYKRLSTRIEGVELRGSKIPVSAFPIVKLQLGDMLHTLIWHNVRHSLQAQEAMAITA